MRLQCQSPRGPETSTLIINKNKQMNSSVQKKSPKPTTCFEGVPQSELTEQPLWRELKVQGKSIQRRSYHSCVQYEGRMYVYGGYDINSGILSDFQCARLEQETVEWQQLAPQECPGYPGKRYSHTAVCYQQQMIVFGGKVSCLGNTSELNCYSFAEGRWLVRKVEGKVPQIDSHSAVVWKDRMLVFGGFIGGAVGKYSNAIYSLDLQQLRWSELAVASKLRPAPRANSAMVEYEGALAIFGGGDLSCKFNDLWKFHANKLQWEKVEYHGCAPESRDGHSLTSVEEKLILFGGIHDITHEKNDIGVYTQGKWQIIEQQSTEQEPLAQESEMALSMYHKKSQQPHNPAELKSKRFYRQLKQLNYNNRQSDHHPQKQQKSKNDIRKHHLLKEFEMTPEQRERFRNHSPTLQSLKNSITAIGSGNPFKKLTTSEQQLKQLQKINKKRKPCARDGHSACLRGTDLIIFGGDRHMMSFNDMFVLDLQLLQLD